MSMAIRVVTTPDASGRRRIRGLESPEEFLAQLASEEWQGPQTQTFTDDLWLYGWDVLRGLVRDGRIRTVPAGLPPVELSPEAWATLAESDEERGAVVLDTLALAVPKTIRNLQQGKYAPERSSLYTYFIGQCAIQFRDVSKSWQSKHHRHNYELSSFDWGEVFGGLPPDDIDRRLDMRRLVARILSGVSARQRVVLVHYFTGHSHGEIAELMGITPRAVEGHLYRAKQAAHNCVSPSQARAVLNGGGEDT